jgi:hypothetical protein
MSTSVDRQNVSENSQAAESVLRARERAHQWRQAKREKGLCPKHGTPVSRLEKCRQCCPPNINSSAQQNSFDKSSSSPVEVGEKLKACFRCESCSTHYHVGAYYHSEDRHNRESLRKYHGLQDGPNNSLINYDVHNPENPDEVLSLCGGCRKEERSEWKYRKTSRWKGLCYSCTRTEKEDFEHRSGATVHPKERHPTRRQIVRFTCANRKPREHKDWVNLPSTKFDSWQGLCSDCQQLLDDPKKIKENEHVGHEGRGA